jgi:hypothetical protein
MSTPCHAVIATSIAAMSCPDLRTERRVRSDGRQPTQPGHIGVEGLLGCPDIDDRRPSAVLIVIAAIVLRSNSAPAASKTVAKSKSLANR